MKGGEKVMIGNKWLYDTEQFKSEYSEKVNKLTAMYIQAFHEFFNVSPTENMDVFFTLAENNCTQKSDFLFLNWLKDRGIIQLKKLMTLNLPYDNSVDSKINLVLGSIEDELSWNERDKKSTRSTVINTLNNLTENLIQLSSLALEKEEIKLLMPSKESKQNFDFISNSISQPLETVVVLISNKIGGFSREQRYTRQSFFSKKCNSTPLC